METTEQQVENASRFARIETHIEHIFESIERLGKGVNGIHRNNRAWLLMIIPTMLIAVDILFHFVGK